MLRRVISALPGCPHGLIALAPLIVACLGGCPSSGPSSGPAAAPASQPAQTTAASEQRDVSDYEAHFVLAWRGARIGDASEWIDRHEDGLRLFREERLAMRRGDAIVAMVTRITVDMDRALAPTRFSISQISGPTERRGQATLAEDGSHWSVRYDGEAVRDLPGDAIPAELVPLYLFAQQRAYSPGDAAFSGPVVLPGYGFALARMEVVVEDARHLVVTVRARPPTAPSGADAVMRGRWKTTRYGSLAAVDSPFGVSARRAHPSELAAPFEAPELVDSASMALTGAPPIGRMPTELVIEPVARDPPPEMPGQRVRVIGHSWRVELTSGDVFAPLRSALPDVADDPPASAGSREWLVLADDIVRRAGARDPRAEIVALARATEVLLDDDLGAPSTHARAALALGRGDCTAHATLFYELARARGIPVLLVTGYRLDSDRLVRHRWALAAVDSAWISVDPTYGEAPATPGLLGLATHHASSAELSLIDETAFAGLVEAHARVQR